MALDRSMLDGVITRHCKGGPCKPPLALYILLLVVPVNARTMHTPNQGVVTDRCWVRMQGPSETKLRRWSGTRLAHSQKLRPPRTVQAPTLGSVFAFFFHPCSARPFASLPREGRKAVTATVPHCTGPAAWWLQACQRCLPLPSTTAKRVFRGD